MLQDVRDTMNTHHDTPRPETNDTAKLRVLAQREHKTPRLRAGQETAFRSLWGDSIPIIVEDVTRMMQCAWEPDDFVKSHGQDRVEMIKMTHPSPTTITVTVAEFFERFFKDGSSEGYAVKVKVCGMSA